MLEQRKDADVVGYNVVWEEIPEQQNVINYNIRKELTFEESSVLSVNNNTTTGKANIIPWINTLRMIWKTSVYNGIRFEDLVIQSTSDKRSAKRILDWTLEWKIFVVYFKVGNDYIVRHLDTISSNYIKFCRAGDSSNYLTINFDATTKSVTSISEVH